MLAALLCIVLAALTVFAVEMYGRSREMTGYVRGCLDTAAMAHAEPVLLAQDPPAAPSEPNPLPRATGEDIDRYFGPRGVSA